MKLFTRVHSNHLLCHHPHFLLVEKKFVMAFLEVIYCTWVFILDDLQYIFLRKIMHLVPTNITNLHFNPCIFFIQYPHNIFCYEKICMVENLANLAHFITCGTCLLCMSSTLGNYKLFIIKFISLNEKTEHNFFYLIN